MSPTLRGLTVVTALGNLERLATVLREQVPAASRTEVADGAVRVWSSATEGILPLIIDIAERAGFTVTDLSATAPTLETVFITLTGTDLRE